ncbi:WXG100 family type VII secretion target [Ectobacillus panaciterrae]|uniref:WXG100 family type VII secretion target n=1 Tax=Ectobacillus panaciterrae TaxID=363872 RepID=UPI0004289A9D|nr:WXG100 family type VII secretion target [Ectobacillus panaciterrae]
MKIRIKPEQVMDVAKQFQQAQQQAQTLAASLRKSIYGLESQWNGVTRERFFQNFQQSNRIIDQYATQTLKADHGVMILESNNHQWLLYQSDNKPSFLVSYLSEELLESQIEKLLHIHNSKEVHHEKS